MKRILALAAALTLSVAAGSAQAHHGGGGGTFWHHHHHHGWAIAGTNASFSGTQASDGTFTGDLTLTVGHRNPTTKTFHLDGTRVKFAQSVGDGNGDGTVDFSDVQPSDVVVLGMAGHHHWSGDHSSRARHARAHRSCDNGSGDTAPSDTTRTPRIKFAFVFSPHSS